MRLEWSLFRRFVIDLPLCPQCGHNSIDTYFALCVAFLRRSSSENIRPSTCTKVARTQSHHIQIDRHLSCPCGLKPEAVSHQADQVNAFQWHSAQIETCACVDTLAVHIHYVCSNDERRAQPKSIVSVFWPHFGDRHDLSLFFADHRIRIPVTLIQRHCEMRNSHTYMNIKYEIPEYSSSSRVSSIEMMR